MAGPAEMVDEQMKGTNDRIVERMRRSIGELKASEGDCAAVPVLGAVIDGQEQGFKNQELMMTHLLDNTPATATNRDTPTGRKVFQVGPFKTEGFDIRDIVRLAFVAIVLAMFARMMGTANTVQGVNDAVQDLKIYVDAQRDRQAYIDWPELKREAAHDDDV